MSSMVGAMALPSFRAHQFHASDLLARPSSSGAASSNAPTDGDRAEVKWQLGIGTLRRRVRRRSMEEARRHEDGGGELETRLPRR
uniref:Uncharacterized protein n=1 Tax=Setaria viridis TaxID=4556 RepID=A0A4U6SWE5_SETVI|nr:hypothetical protein SEVIR_9G108100v2 [Setaria viridis]